MSIRMGSRSCVQTQTITDCSAIHQVLLALGTLSDAQYPSTRTPTKSLLCRSGSPRQGKSLVAGSLRGGALFVGNRDEVKAR
jgi:hypothetical protein